MAVGVMVIVSTDQVGSGVIKRELVLISVAVTTCVSYSKIVVTTKVYYLKDLSDNLQI